MISIQICIWCACAKHSPSERKEYSGKGKIPQRAETSRTQPLSSSKVDEMLLIEIIRLRAHNRNLANPAPVDAIHEHVQNWSSVNRLFSNHPYKLSRTALIVQTVPQLPITSVEPGQHCPLAAEYAGSATPGSDCRSSGLAPQSNDEVPSKLIHHLPRFESSVPLRSEPSVRP